MLHGQVDSSCEPRNGWRQTCHPADQYRGMPECCTNTAGAAERHHDTIEGARILTQYSFPFGVDGRGRTATATEPDHIKQLVRQVLFTALNERVNRPTFGSGINQLVFAPNSSELASATQYLVQGALQQWLGSIIHIESVKVTNEESTLHVVVQYVVRRTQHRELAEFLEGP